MPSSAPAPEETARKPRSARFWLGLALAFAAFYSLLALRLAFASQHLVQDDARQHVFWMRRFLDPSLFPNDLIADYFQSVAPLGYKAVYWTLARVGMDPLLTHKLLPALIGLVCAYLAFRVFMEILPDPRGAFVASLLLNQALWMKDDVMSATPRAFVYPLFLAFMLFFLRRQLLPCAAMVLLLGVFYPQAIFIAAGVLVLSLIRWENGRFRLSRERSDYVFCGVGLAAAAAVMLPFVLSASQYGPVISGKEARLRPEFWENGRSRFFMDSWRFWHNMDRSGLLPRAVQSPFMWMAPALPWFFLKWRGHRLIEAARPRAGLLVRVTLVAVFMWTAAHLLLFKLHLPSRYTHWSFRILLALAAGILLVALWDRIQEWIARQKEEGRASRARWAGYAAGLAFLTLIVYPHFSSQYPDNSYKPGTDLPLYRFLLKQPKDTLVASIYNGTDAIPTFAQRSILVGREYAIPYHLGYADRIRQRGQDLVRAQYTEDPQELLRFLRTYGVDLWIVERKAFTPEYLQRRAWFGQIEPGMARMREALREGKQPVLRGLVDRCRVWERKELVVLSAARIEEALAAAPPAPQDRALP